MLSYAGVPFSPMLLWDGPAPFNAPDSTYEITFDGWRALALVQDGRLQLVSRKGNDLLRRFGDLAAVAKGLSGDPLIDGEVIAGDGTLASFKTLLARASVHAFVAFDVLAVDGRPLVDEPIRTAVRLVGIANIHVQAGGRLGAQPRARVVVPVGVEG